MHWTAPLREIAPFISGAVGGLFTLLAAWFITGYLTRNIKSHEFLFQFTNRYQDILATKHKLNHQKDAKGADARELYRRLFSLVFDEFHAYQQGFLDHDIFAEWMKWRRDDYRGRVGQKGDKVAGVTYKDAWETFRTTGPLIEHNFCKFLNQIHDCKDYEVVGRVVEKYAPRFSRRTIFLSRSIGLFALFVAVSMLAHRDSIILIKSTIFHDVTLFRTASMFLIIAGLAIVLGHNIWTKGLLALVVTVLGWLILAAGLIAFWAPHECVTRLENSRYNEWFYWYAGGVVLVVGAYLTIDGFLSSAGFPGRDSKTARAAKHIVRLTRQPFLICKQPGIGSKADWPRRT